MLTDDTEESSPTDETAEASATALLKRTGALERENRSLREEAQRLAAGADSAELAEQQLLRDIAHQLCKSRLCGLLHRCWYSGARELLVARGYRGSVAARHRAPAVCYCAGASILERNKRSLSEKTTTTERGMWCSGVLINPDTRSIAMTQRRAITCRSLFWKLAKIFHIMRSDWDISFCIL